MRHAFYLSALSLEMSLVLSLSRVANAEPCRAFQPLLDWQKTSYPQTTTGVQASQRDRTNAANLAARNLFAEYSSGQTPNFSAELCGVGAIGRREFEYAQGPTFFTVSREILVESGEPLNFRLVSLLNQRFGANGVPPVRFVLESRVDSDPDRSVGVARGNKAFFASLSEIPSTDWKIIFVHEVAHLVDASLDAAVQRWQDPKLRSLAVSEAKTWMTQPSSSVGDKTPNLDLWLLAGLERGLLAEYRAWVVTSEIYKSMRQRNLQPELEWMKLISEPGESLASSKTRVFQHLDPKFTNPIGDNIFTMPGVESRLNFLREKLRNDALTHPPSLGALESIFEL